MTEPNTYADKIAALLRRTDRATSRAEVRAYHSVFES